MTRDEHLAWCRERAEDYIRDGRFGLAVQSVASDLTKHDDTSHLAFRAAESGTLLLLEDVDEAAFRCWLDDVG